MSEDRPRKSWRDIDKQRDQSTHRRDERPQGGPRGKSRSQKSYRAALDRLFETGKIADLVEKEAPVGASSGSGEESRLKLLKRIADAEGRDSITKAIDAYLKSYPSLPNDAEVLGKVLQHRDYELQLQAMKALLALTETEKPRRTRAILGQLKLLRDTGEDPEMVELSRTLIDRLE